MNINSKLVKNSRVFFREEKNGKLLIIPEECDQNNSILIDSTGKLILELCDSKNTIKNIVDILSIKFKDNDKQKIENDVRNFIDSMIKNRVIKKIKEDTMYTGIDIVVDNEYTVHRCGEGDFSRIINIFEKSKNLNNTMEKIFITNRYDKYLQIPNLMKLNLRNNLYKFMEEIYILVDSKNNEDIGMIGLLDVSNNHTRIYEIISINYINNRGDISELESLISVAINDISKNICNGLNKIKINLNNKFDHEILDIFTKLMFEKVGHLKNEYGEGRDQIILEKYI